jgi:hypothetical protein
MTFGSITIRRRRIAITFVWTSLSREYKCSLIRLVESLSKRYRSGENNDDMQRRIVTEARGYQSNFLELQSLLDQLGSDKGLANYDDTNDLETLLKNIVNLNKCLLTEVYDLINDIPVLGPVLGPSKSSCVQHGNYSDLAISLLRN